MKIMAWNCHGLGKVRAVRALLDLQKQIKPDVLFLSETHLGKDKAKQLKRRNGFDHMIIHESDGRSGGLVMLWMEGIRIRELETTEMYIDVVVEGDVAWRLTGVYGEPKWD